MCVLQCSEGKKGVSIEGLLPVESVNLVHSQRHPLRQRHWTKLNYWAHDYWLFGGTVEVVTTLAHCQNWCRLIHSPRRYQYQQPVQIFRWASTTVASCFLNSLYYKEPLTPTVKCLLGRKISSVCNTACKQSTKSKKWNAIYPALNGGSFKRKGWQIQFCLLQPVATLWL